MSNVSFESNSKESATMTESLSSHHGSSHLPPCLSKTSSIYAKLAITFTLLIITVGSAVVFLGYQSMRDYYQEITQELNKDIAMYMADSYQLDVEDLVKSRTELGRISERSMVLNPSLEIYLLDQEGIILDHNQPPQDVLQTQVELLPIKQFLTTDRRFPLRGIDPRSDTDNKIFSVFPIKQGLRTQGYVYVILGGQLFDNIAANIRSSYVIQTSLYIALLVVIASLVIGLIAFKSITSRLAELTTAMLEFTCERPTTVLFSRNQSAEPASSNDEIEVLKQSFTKLTAKIEEQFNHLKQADQHRRELVSNISHDLRTPLAITKGYIETLCIKNDQLDEAQRLEYLHIAQRSNEQLTVLIEDLFALSKLETGQIVLKSEPFSLLELIYDTVQEFDILASKKNIEIRVPSPTHNVLVNADIALIQRVFANLISNAIKFTPQQGTVSIDFSVTGSHIKIVVKDTGCGIAPEDLPHIFERHYFNTQYEKASLNLTQTTENNSNNLDSLASQKKHQLTSTALHNNSSGLGLAIVKKILEMHNSSIQVSNLVTKGVQFQFKLPVLKS
jgi:signal transduction histidine kinase